MYGQSPCPDHFFARPFTRFNRGYDSHEHSNIIYERSLREGVSLIHGRQSTVCYSFVRDMSALFRPTQYIFAWWDRWEVSETFQHFLWVCTYAIPSSYREGILCIAFSTKVNIKYQGHCSFSLTVMSMTILSNLNLASGHIRYCRFWWNIETLLKKKI